MANMTAATLCAVVALALTGPVLAAAPHGLRGMIGGDTDTHGCLTAGGFTWCEAKAKCLRVWEESCPTSGDAGHFCAAGLVWCESISKCVRPWLCTSEGVAVRPPGGDSDSHGCKASAGYTWCQGKGRCIRTSEEACPKAEDAAALTPCASGLSWCNAKQTCIDPATTSCPHGAIADLITAVGKPPGSDKDAHGCIRSAGYTWCAGKSRCVRLFEETCPKAEDAAALTPCASGLSWCNAKQTCIDPATTSCPHGADF